MILALDTSGAISVAICAPDGQHALVELTEYAPRSHAELLAVMVRTALRTAGVDGADVTGVVVGTGPAPFTGLRVGLMTARVLGLAWGVPVRGACSLDAVGAEHGATVTVVTDARRREVYWARYVAGERVSGPAVSAPGDVTVEGDVVGRGVALYPDEFGERSGGGLLDPRPAWLARLVATQEASGATEFSTQPLYLRRPDVHGRVPA